MLNIQKKLAPSFFALLSLPCTGMGFALSVQISALSWILSTKYGLDIHEVGLVWAAGPIAGILAQPLVGAISDKAWFWGGRRRPFMLIGGVLASIMLLALPNIDKIADAGLGGILGVAVAVTLMLDLSINVSFNPTRAIIADVTPDDHRRTRGYTWMQTISGFFGVLAYFIGAEWGNEQLIYFGSVLVLLFSIIPPFFIEEPREIQSSSEAASESPGLLQVFQIIRPLWGFLAYAVFSIALYFLRKNPDLAAQLENVSPGLEIVCVLATVALFAQTFLKDETKLDTAQKSLLSFRKILAAHSFTWLGIQTMFVYMFAWMQYRFTGLDDAGLGRFIAYAFLTFNAVAALLPALVLEPLAKRFSRVAVHRWCIASMSLAYVLLLLIGSSQANVYVVMALLGIGWSSTISLVFAIMSRRVDQSQMGLYMGLFNLSVVLPQLAVSSGIGLLLKDAVDKDLTFYISAGSLAVSALLWFLIRERKEKIAA